MIIFLAVQTYVSCTQNNLFIETILLSTHIVSSIKKYKKMDIIVQHFQNDQRQHINDGLEFKIALKISSDILSWNLEHIFFYL